MLSMVHRWMFGPKAQPAHIDLPGYGVIECKDCHQFLRTGFALSLIGHLAKQHQMKENKAIEVGTHMLDLFYSARLKRRRELESGD
jgi:hypothetical protein